MRCPVTFQITKVSSGLETLSWLEPGGKRGVDPPKDEGYRVPMDAEIWVVLLPFSKWDLSPRCSPFLSRMFRLPLDGGGLESQRI